MFPNNTKQKAMKKMKKNEMDQKNQVEHVKAERDVLVKAKTRKTVFFDSIYVAFLLLALPIYWLMVYLIINVLI
jgi:hypothetical protein